VKMMSEASSDFGVFAVSLLVFLAAAAGWIMNLVIVFHAGEAGQAVPVIRFLAIFVWPVGCVLGWF